MLSPPWIPVPAPAYGGIEEVVRLLCDGLTANDHDVTLFAPPGSDSCAAVVPLLEEPHPDDIQKAQYEADHVARAFAAIDAAAERGEPFDDAARRFYAQHGRKARIVAISQAQLDSAPPEMGGGDVVHNPIDCSEWPFREEKDDFLLWIGRMSPDKGPQRAITAAREAGAPLVLAGPVQPGQEAFFAEEVEPQLGRDGIEYIGEADSERKRDLFQRARALLMPIRWPEPFGLVMVESLACGTPVIAFPEGSAPEVVEQGRTGFVVGDEHAMAQAVERLDEIEPSDCRGACERRFGVAAVVRGYEEVYRAAAARGVPA